MLWGFVDVTYLIFIVPAAIIAIWAQVRVKSTYSRYGQMLNREGLTGAQAARLILDRNGLQHIRIERVSGSLTDHYSPKENVIRLSDSVYDSATISAVGVAAHEAGHAVQYAEGYGPIQVRAAIIPVTQVGSQFGIVLLIVGILLTSEPLFLVGIILFSFTTLFQLITLPVEFNASRRAMETIRGQQLLTDEEADGVRKVLSAAAMTYVAALLMSIVQLLRFVLMFAGRRRD